jgi:hypothetical protein
MEPEVYLAGEKLPELHVPDIAKLSGNEWEKYDVGSIGEFDVGVMAEQYAGEDEAKKIAPQWRGGWYYAVKRKGADAIGMVFVTRWSTCAGAQNFEKLYAGTIATRYKHARPGGGLETGIAGDCGPARDSMWQTSEGQVWLARSGDTLVVVEGLDAALAAKARDAVLAGKH